MWFLLPMYLLNLLLLLKPHLVPLLRILLGLLGRFSVDIAKSMAMLSLSVTAHSLSNLPTRILHFILFELLLLLLLKRILKALFPNFPWEIFKLFYNNFSQTLVNLPHKFCHLGTSPSWYFDSCLLQSYELWSFYLFFQNTVLLVHLLFILQIIQLCMFKT